MADALTTSGFDRWKFSGACSKNAGLYSDADVCGKCVVGLPCSTRCP